MTIRDRHGSKRSGGLLLEPGPHALPDDLRDLLRRHAAVPV